MPLDINKGCKDRLSESLLDCLPKIQVTNDRYLTDSRLIFFIPEQALPDKGLLRKKLAKYIGDYPFYTYCSDQVSTDLAERFKFRSGEDERKLVEMEGYEDPQMSACNLVNDFEALPYHYSLALQLPENISQNFCILDRRLQISEDVALRVANDSFRDEYPLNSQDPNRQQRIHPPLSLLSMDSKKPKEWDEKACYLVIKVEGYIDRYGSTAPAASAKNLAKSFFGFCIALGLFKAELKLPQMDGSIVFFVHKKSGDTWEIDGKFSVDDRVERTLKDLKFITFKPKYDNEKFKGGYILDRLAQIQTVFRNRKDAARLMLAAQWYFDGYARQDETLSFVQTVVVLEVLLGDKADSDQMGLGALLKNRAAYMIAESTLERETLLKDISAIYSLRSKIVHAGKHYFEPQERALFSNLRRICRRIFQREIKLLAKETDEKNQIKKVST